MTAGLATRRADLAFFAALSVGLLFVAFLGPFERRLELVHDNDFSGFWAGARALVTGHDPYDAATWVATTVALGTVPPRCAAGQGQHRRAACPPGGPKGWLSSPARWVAL